MVEGSNEAKWEAGVDLGVSYVHRNRDRHKQTHIHTYTLKKKETNKERKNQTMMGRQLLLSWSLLFL